MRTRWIVSNFIICGRNCGRARLLVTDFIRLWTFGGKVPCSTLSRAGVVMKSQFHFSFSFIFTRSKFNSFHFLSFSVKKVTNDLSIFSEKWQVTYHFSGDKWHFTFSFSFPTFHFQSKTCIIKMQTLVGFHSALLSFWVYRGSCRFSDREPRDSLLISAKSAERDKGIMWKAGKVTNDKSLIRLFMISHLS